MHDSTTPRSAAGDVDSAQRYTDGLRELQRRRGAVRLASGCYDESEELIPGSPTYRLNCPPETVVTCDWGDCENPAVTVRYDREVTTYGWLPVCQACRAHPERSWQSARIPLSHEIEQVMQAAGVDRATAVIRLGGRP